jgi:hypothetical protein
MIAVELEDLGACDEAVEWVGARDAIEAWNDCPRGDWLLWILGKLEADRKRLVLCAHECIEAAVLGIAHECVHRCLILAKRWAVGDCSDEELHVAEEAVHSYITGLQSDALVRHVDAAYAVSYVVESGSTAARYAAATVDNPAEYFAKCAGTVRSYFPDPPLNRSRRIP